MTPCSIVLDLKIHVTFSLFLFIYLFFIFNITHSGKTTQIRDVPCCPQYICLDFLLGRCSKEQLCDHYHYTSTPYMWQHKLEDPSSDHQGDIWKSFTRSENEAIEQQFCNVNVVVADMEHIMIEPPSSVL